jgi:hypothetical protein
VEGAVTCIQSRLGGTDEEARRYVENNLLIILVFKFVTIENSIK